MKRNPESPWNPNEPCIVSPDEYEKQVLSWLRLNSRKLTNIKIDHLKKISGSGGEYEFDIVVEFSIFQGANISVLVECKRYRRPVEREKILSLNSKIQDVGAHKGMIFSTSGFQSGALEYAKDRGIACIIFVDGKFNFETKSYLPEHEPPPWANICKYAGIIIESENNRLHCQTFDDNYNEYLKEFFCKFIN